MAEPFVPPAGPAPREGDQPTLAGGARRAPGPSSGGWLRAIAVRGAFVLFGLGVAAGLAEIALRIFGHEGPVYTIRDPVIGRRYTRSWEGDCTIEEADRVVHLRFNREGMRDRDWPEERAEGTLRIAVLGDSMVAALGVDEDRTFVRLLEGRLQALEAAAARPKGRPARRVEVMNWGVQGSSPALESVLYDVRIRHYHPDLLVCVFFTGNDFSDDWQPIGGRRQGWGEVRPDGTLEHEPFGGSEFSLNEWLARNSRLYVWQKRVLARLHDDGEAPLRPGLRLFDTSGDPELAKAWAFQRQVQARLVKLARDAGTDALRVVLPAADEVHDELWQAAVARAALVGWRLRPTFAWSQVEQSDRVDMATCPDLSMGPEPIRPLGWDGLWSAMRKEVDGRPSTDPRAQLYLRGSGHLNERGHELVARELAAQCAGLLLR